MHVPETPFHSMLNSESESDSELANSPVSGSMHARIVQETPFHAQLGVVGWTLTPRIHRMLEVCMHVQETPFHAQLGVVGWTLTPRIHRMLEVQYVCMESMFRFWLAVVMEWHENNE
jgi:hypothetical protein